MTIGTQLAIAIGGKMTHSAERGMDTWGREHLSTWLERQFGGVNSPLLTAMIAKFNDDPEFWANQDYMRLFDACRSARACEACGKPSPDKKLADWQDQLCDACCDSLCSEEA